MGKGASPGTKFKFKFGKDSFSWNLPPLPRHPPHLTKGHAEDTGYFMRRGMHKGYQALSLLAPSVYVAVTMFRYGRSYIALNRLLRATWEGGATGAGVGGVFEFTRSSFYISAHELRNKRLRVENDAASLRADNYSTFGTIVCAMAAPALLWKQANIMTLIFGGAGIGSTIGLLTHYGQGLIRDNLPKKTSSTTQPPPSEPGP